MEKLRPLLNEPKRRQLYLAIRYINIDSNYYELSVILALCRPLIPSRVRAEYNSHIPHVPR